MARRYWLMKSEPGTYSIHDLERDGTTAWDGVRNYRARNFLRDEIQPGDLVLFHHSNADPPGVAGIAKVAKGGYPDPTQFDRKSKYFDAKAERSAPRWFLVDVTFEEKFEDVVSLAAMKEEPALDGMWVLKKGMRLSVQPVEKAHFERVRKMGRAL
ncbi:MAG: EVE domain-containing protein [bacterium]|nr:EVE domain-containing protein [Gemmatimonadota bacterium]